MELQPPHTSEPVSTTWQSYFDFAEVLQADNIPGLNVRCCSDITLEGHSLLESELKA